jgi:hypothetical protein
LQVEQAAILRTTLAQITQAAAGVLVRPLVLVAQVETQLARRAQLVARAAVAVLVARAVTQAAAVMLLAAAVAQAQRAAMVSSAPTSAMDWRALIAWGQQPTTAL